MKFIDKHFHCLSVAVKDLQAQADSKDQRLHSLDNNRGVSNATDNGCSWTREFKAYEVTVSELDQLCVEKNDFSLVLQVHYKQYDFDTKECDFCGHAFPILELASHVAASHKLCPLVGLGCTAGRVRHNTSPFYITGLVWDIHSICNFFPQMSALQLEKHCTELIAEHFHWLSVAVKDLQVQVDKGQPHLRDIPEEDDGGNYDSAYGSFNQTVPQESQLSSAGVAEANTTPSPRTKDSEATQMQKAEQETHHDHLKSQLCTNKVTLLSPKEDIDFSV